MYFQHFTFTVVALTYELESKLIGCEHLRTSPVNCIKVNEGFGDDKITNLAGNFRSCFVELFSYINM